MGTLDHLKGEVRMINREFDSMVKKINVSFSSLWINVQTAPSNGVEKLLSIPAGKSLDSSAKTIGQCVHDLKSTSATAISSSVSGVVEDFRTLRRNVERNVQALRSGGGDEGMNDSQQPTSPSPPAASRVIAFPSSKRDMLAGVVSPRVDGQTGRQSLQEPPLSSVPSTISSSEEEEEEVAEEDAHPDHSSVSATSVFSIGYVGPPLLGPRESESFVYVSNKSQGSPSIGTETAQEASGPAPALRLEDVRKSTEMALIVYKKIRALGIQESSWENKMPWRNPRPASLANGLKWPRQKFSSMRERHEYHRKARRRGRYLIGPTPGWSWFAADIAFLYFLINNPAGNFLI